MSAGKIVLLVFGVLVLLGAVGLLFGGGVLVWAYHAPTDSEGFVSTGPVEIERASHAVVTGPVDLDEDALAVLDWMGFGAVRLVGSSNDPSRHIFMGIGRESDVEAYLSDADYDEMTQVTHWLSFRRVEYTNHPGNSEPAAPASETFWTVSEHGAGTQTLEWEPEEGRHSLVLMNADASAGVDLSVAFKIQVPVIVFAIGVALLAGGTVALILGILMVYFAVRRP